MDKTKFEDYEGFVGKFKPKLTTDDCYTPPEVYDAVLSYVRRRGWGEENTPIIRPFYPGGDYEKHEYPEGCAVVDNPPFSIITPIVRNYMDAGVGFFLFAPHLTLLSPGRLCCAVVSGALVTYENGAQVRTSFDTNLVEGVAIMTASGWSKELEEIEKKKERRGKITIVRISSGDFDRKSPS